MVAPAIFQRANELGQTISGMCTSVHGRLDYRHEILITEYGRCGIGHEIERIVNVLRRHFDENVAMVMNRGNGNIGTPATYRVCFGRA